MTTNILKAIGLTFLCVFAAQCAGAIFDDLSALPKRGGESDAYEEKKDLLRSGNGKRRFSSDDLKQLLDEAKDRGDFETHAQAYHRLKVEFSTEEEGGIVVIKIKEHGLPVAVTAVVIGTVSAILTRYYYAQASGA